MSKKVLNISQADEQACQCGSWLNHWEKISGRKQWLCPEVNCDNRASVGALVIKPAGCDDRLYVLPLCHQHGAQAGTEIEVVEAAMLVPAYSGAKCGLQAAQPREGYEGQAVNPTPPMATSDKQ
jgi:hypothetical protein